MIWREEETSVLAEKTDKKSWRRETQAENQLPRESLQLCEKSLSQAEEWRNWMLSFRRWRASEPQAAAAKETPWEPASPDPSRPPEPTRSLCTMWTPRTLAVPPRRNRGAEAEQAQISMKNSILRPFDSLGLKQGCLWSLVLLTWFSTFDFQVVVLWVWRGFVVKMVYIESLICWYYYFLLYYMMKWIFIHSFLLSEES